MNCLTDAEKLLQELGITEPEEIDLEVIAWHVGAIIKRKKLDGCEARIVGAGDKAIITVNSTSVFVRQQFSIGHEIGHWHYHRGKSLVCRSNEIGNFHHSGGAILERQADKFASNLLLPNYILSPYLNQFKKLCFDAIRKTAKSFGTSLPATAIGLIERGRWPAMLICHGHEGRKWFVRNTGLSERWFPNDELHYESNAIGILYGNDPDQISPRKTSARFWFNCRDAYRQDIYEQSIRTQNGEVLSLLLFQ